MPSIVMKQTVRGRVSPSSNATATARASYQPVKRQRPSPSSFTTASPSPHLQQQQQQQHRAFILTHGGGSLSILIMKCTLGGMILLILVQGTMWLVNLTSSSQSDHHHVDSTNLRGEAAKKHFESQRDSALQQMRRLGGSGGGGGSKSKNKPHPMCQMLLLPGGSGQTETTKQRWMNHVGAILSASRHPEDKDFFFENWTKRLLSEISPPLLESSTSRQSMDDPMGTLIADVLNVVYQKLIHPDTAPPLRIAVLGGSHTEGSTCSEVSVNIPETTADTSSSLSTILANPMFCAWPFRLESFINTLAGFPLVEIVNLAEDGTDTDFMTPLVQNGIYPPSLLPNGPDLLLHAYRQTDYASDPSQLRDTIQRDLSLLLQGRSASHPCRRRPPMVIHLDDSTLNTDAVIAMTDLITIQSDQAIRRAMETDFQTEPGSMAAHMALTWVVAFNLMDLTLQYCNSNIDQTKWSPRMDANIENATQCQQPSRVSALSSSSSPTPTCPFCFFASPIGTVRTTMELQHYIKRFTVHNEGWQVVADMSTGWSRKIGLVATQAQANILFRIAQIDRPVRSLHIMTLRSSGDEWKGSLARFRLAVMTPPPAAAAALLDSNNNGALPPPPQLQPQPTVETRFDVTGYHDSIKHVTYHFTVDMKQYEAPVGSDIMLSVELVEGSKFKILGLMLCS